MNWRWIDKRLLLLLHDESLSMHGGASGMRDEGLLDSALARPLDIVAHGEPDVADLAAACGFGLAKNHPYIDGNKRTAFLAVGLFLRLNGQRLVASQTDATLTMLQVAGSELSEPAFADWLRKNMAAT